MFWTLELTIYVSMRRKRPYGLWVFVLISSAFAHTNPKLDTSISVLCPSFVRHAHGTPSPWILKRGELESSDQIASPTAL